jgi:hypothetical protein
MTDAIRFLIGEEIGDLTWDEWISLEEGASSKTKEIMSRFLVDESGAPIEGKLAKETLGKVKVKELAGITAKFWKAMRDKAANPTTGD